MEEDIDIYADLSTFDEKSNDKCKNCLEFETQLDVLKKAVGELQKVNKNLETNISSLLLTAKGEVSRKDRMIAELRQKLDDVTFRRGNSKRYGNYKSNSVNSESTGDGAVFVPSEPPPSLPKEFDARIPPPSLPKKGTIEIVIPSLQNVINTSEFTCNYEQWDDEEEDTEQKYETGKIPDTLYSKRLREKLENEEIEKKILQEEKAEKLLEEGRKQREVLNKETEKNGNRELVEETIKDIKPLVDVNKIEHSSECSLDNKENFSSSNQVNTNSEFSVTQSKVPVLNEEESLRNKTLLVNKHSTKRSCEDNDEEINIKRLKVEQLKEYDNFREDWSNGATKSVKVKDSDCLHLTSGKKNNVEKSKGSREEERVKRREKIENPSYDSLASRLYQLSEQSLNSYQERRDSNKRRDDTKLGFREREKYNEKLPSERYVRDKYKDRGENERYERNKQDCHKLERVRYDKYKRENDRFENNVYAREKYEREYFEKDNLNRKMLRKSESLSPERKSYNRHKDCWNSEFKDNLGNRVQRSTNLENENSPRMFHRPDEQESKYILENFNHRRERDLFKGDASRRSKSNSNDNRGGRKRELYKCSSNSERSRSNSKDKDSKTDPDKKISLENYRARRGQKSVKSENRSRSRNRRNRSRSGRSRSSSKDSKGQKDARLEKELSKCDSRKSRSNSKDTVWESDSYKKINLENYKSKSEQKLVKGDSSERSKDKKQLQDQNIEGRISVLENYKASVEKKLSEFDSETKKNKDKDCRNAFSEDLPSSSVDRKTDLKNRYLKLPDKVEKSKCDEELEEGEISNSFSDAISPAQVDGKEERKESLVPRDSESAVIFEGESKNLEKLPSVSIGKDKIENLKTEGKEENKSLNPVNGEANISENLNEKCEEIEIFSKGKSSGKVSPNLVYNIEENMRNNLEKHVQSLDSFIESARKVLEENKKEYGMKEIIGEFKGNVREEEELEEEVEIEVVYEEEVISEEKEIENKNENQKYLPKKVILSSDKQREEQKKAESQGREEVEQISSVVKEKKKCRQTESKEREVRKEVPCPTKQMRVFKQTKSNRKEGDKEISSSNREKKVKIKEEENLKAKVSEPSKELILPEFKKEVRLSKISESDEKQEEIQPTAVSPSSNISSSVKERRKQMKETQKLVEVTSKPKEEVKAKEIKKQTQKVKQEVSEIKHKTKKSEEKLNKKFVVVVQRKRPVVLSDSNASKTIVSSQNVIMNIKLNTNGDKNLLS